MGVKKHPGGRPRKTLNDLPKGWKGEALRLYRDGAADIEVIAMLGISRDLFYRFLADEPEFSDAIKTGANWRRPGGWHTGAHSWRILNFLPLSGT